MLTATIIRLPSGRIYVRIGPTAENGGDVEIIETLNGYDRDELKERAQKFVNDRFGQRVG